MEQSAKLPCSNCSANETSFNPLRVSEYDEKPLCKLCFEHQCCKCGCFSEEDDPEDEEYHWLDGSLYCEGCSTRYICNQCGGDCDFYCPVCNSAHDNECGCDVTCSKCGDEFTYMGHEMFDRKDTPFWNDGAKEICDECWEELVST